MTTYEAIFYDPRSVPRSQRILVRAAVGAARLLATQPPSRIAACLRLLQRRTRPATLERTAAARRAVELVSLRCAGPQGCLPRSLAVVLLCRLRGQWPTWCVGVRRMAPFGAHAWVEAGGVAVGEVYPPGYFGKLLSVP